MDLEDRTIVHTPEGVELQLLLAGAASRFIAGTVDLAIQVSTILLIAIVAVSSAGLTNGLSVAIFVVVQFVVLYGYNVFFEVLVAGRTPGKRLSHMRVVDDRGGPVSLQASVIRNLIRLLEMALLYLPALCSILITSRNQRIGDLAAGTIVIRDDGQQGRSRLRWRRARKSSPREPAASGDTAPPSVTEGLLWDLSAVSREELGIVRHFLDRREGLNPRARHELASQLAQGLHAKVAGSPDYTNPEEFLETLSAIKAGR